MKIARGNPGQLHQLSTDSVGSSRDFCPSLYASASPVLGPFPSLVFFTDATPFESVRLGDCPENAHSSRCRCLPFLRYPERGAKASTEAPVFRDFWLRSSMTYNPTNSLGPCVYEPTKRASHR